MKPGHWTALGTVLAGAAAAITALAGVWPFAGGDEPPVPDIDGPWSYSEVWRFESLLGRCNSEGTVRFEQAGSTFHGEYSQELSCTDGISLDQPQTTGQIVSGVISGSQITFQTVNSFDQSRCSYTGAAQGQPINAIDGTAFCDATPGNTATWLMRRSP